MEQLGEYITLQGAAEKLRITRRGVHKRITIQKIPTIRLGNLVLVKWEDIKNSKGDHYETSTR